MGMLRALARETTGFIAQPFGKRFRYFLLALVSLYFSLFLLQLSTGFLSGALHGPAAAPAKTLPYTGLLYFEIGLLMASALWLLVEMALAIVRDLKSAWQLIRRIFGK